MTSLSVVVPARNEAARLPDTIARLRVFLDGNPDAELVLALDKESVDDTLAVAERLVGSDPRVTLVYVDPVGKGYAVARGMEGARGDVVLMADADLAVDPSDFAPLVEAARGGAVAVASRSAPGARRIGEPVTRYLMGRAFNFVVRMLLLPGVRDSQCGFKAMPMDVARSLFADLRTTGWVFDVELLALARRRGIPVRELPVRWTYGHGSSLRPLNDAPSVVRELLDVRRRIGRIR